MRKQSRQSRRTRKGVSLGKKALCCLTALTLSVMMVPPVALAETIQESVENTDTTFNSDVTSTNKDYTLYVYSGGDDSADASATVNGDVEKGNGSSVTGGAAAYARSDSDDTASITVNGEVTATGAGSGAYAYTYGEGKTEINVQDDVSLSGTSGGYYAAARAEAPSGGEAAVTVGGDVSSSTHGVKTDANNNGKTKVDVTGNVEATSTGVRVESKNGGESDVHVGGDVTSTGYYGVYDYSTNNGGKTTIKVDGTVTGAGTGIYGGAFGQGSQTSITTGDVLSENYNGVVFSASRGATSELKTGDIASGARNYLTNYNGGNLTADLGDVTMIRSGKESEDSPLEIWADNRGSGDPDSLLKVTAGDVTSVDGWETAVKIYSTYGTDKTKVDVTVGDIVATKGSGLSVSGSANNKVVTGDIAATGFFGSGVYSSTSGKTSLTTGDVISTLSNSIAAYEGGETTATLGDVISTGDDYTALAVSAGYYIGQLSTGTADVTANKLTGDNGLYTYVNGDESVVTVSTKDILATDGIGVRTGGASGTTNVTVDGDINAKWEGLFLEAAGNYSVLGDVTSSGLADDEHEIAASALSADGENGVQDILVTGTITGAGNAVDVYNWQDDQVKLTTWAIKGAEGEDLFYGDDDQGTFAHSVDYIIKVEQPQNGTAQALKANGDELDKSHDFDVAHQDDKVILAVEPDPGFRIIGAYNGQGDDRIPLLMDDAGMYYLIVPEGGAVYLTVELTDKYKIQFVNEDGTELQTDYLQEGDTPAYTGDTPTKEPTAQYTYEFAGWQPTIDPVTGDATYTAMFTPITREYTVKFVNDDGTELQSGDVAYDAVPVYEGETPEKAATAQYTYTFKEWTPAIDKVTGEITYTATYTATVNKYDVTFVDDDGEELQSSKVEYGKTPSYTGEVPSKEAPDEHHSYVFIGWTPAIDKVTGAITYTATYNLVAKDYNVTFVNDDESVLQKGLVPYGETPKYEGKTPAKEATAQYEYVFVGWTPEIDKVTGDVTYTATYTQKLRSYDMTFDLAGGTLDGTTGPIVVAADYGSVIEILGAPTREGYKFLYWKGSEYQPGDKYTVEGAHTFTAVWEKETTPEPDPDKPEDKSSKVEAAYSDSRAGTIPKLGDDEFELYAAIMMFVSLTAIGMLLCRRNR